MNYIEKITQNLNYINIIQSIIITIISIFLYKCFTYLMTKSEKNIKNKKSKTYLKLIRSVIRYIFIVVTFLILLQTNGVDVSSLLAGVGIAGAIIGLAVQDWLKDIIRGSTILSDSYFEVGDVVKYKDIEGKVLEVGLKTTKIQDLKTSNIVSVANRNIEVIEKVSNLIYVGIPMPYEVKLSKAEKVIDKIIENVKLNDNVTNCKYKSVSELEDSCVRYLIQIECDQNYKLQVKRDANRSILEILDKNGIQVPYKQIDIHNK